MFTVVYDVNTHVEEAYASDKVKVNLDEATFNVKVTCVDESNNDLAGINPIADKTFASLTPALEYYKKLIDQLYQGDVIRNF